MSTVKRIMKEYRDLLQSPIPNCQAEPVNLNDVFQWEAQINGPENTPYQNGTFRLKIVFPPNYPFNPPKVQFLTKIFHPNINSGGAICLDILKDQWSPVLTIDKVLLSISSLLADPNPNDPLVTEIAELYRQDYQGFVKNAKIWTTKYANPNPNPNPNK